MHNTSWRLTNTHITLQCSPVCVIAFSWSKYTSQLGASKGCFAALPPSAVTWRAMYMRARIWIYCCFDIPWTKDYIFFQEILSDKPIISIQTCITSTNFGASTDRSSIKFPPQQIVSRTAVEHFHEHGQQTHQPPFSLTVRGSCNSFFATRIIPRL